MAWRKGEKGSIKRRGQEVDEGSKAGAASRSAWQRHQEQEARQELGEADKGKGAKLRAGLALQGWGIHGGS